MLIKPTIYIVLGIIIGIAFTKLFTSSNSSPQNIQVTKPSLLKEETTKTAVHYQQKVDSLNDRAKDLTNKLTNTKTELTIAKNRTLVLKTQLIAVNEKNIISTGETQALNSPPAENILAQFIDANNNKDSLYENIDSSRLQQLENKDAVLAVKDSMYNALKESFSNSVLQQELLFTQNKLLRRQVNRQKLKGKLVSAAVLIVSVSAANYLLKH